MRLYPTAAGLLRWSSAGVALGLLISACYQSNEEEGQAEGTGTTSPIAGPGGPTSTTDWSTTSTSTTSAKVTTGAASGSTESGGSSTSEGTHTDGGSTSSDGSSTSSDSGSTEASTDTGTDTDTNTGSEDTDDEGACTPDCADRACGLDPICQQPCGVCPAGHACHEGLCICEPACNNLECGLDPVCNTSCGDCRQGESCKDGHCNCVPECGSRECGEEPNCGASCGTCGQGFSCVDGLCQEDDCIPDCSGRTCGPDPTCHQSCGACDDGWSCHQDTGQCICQPQCTGLACGDDPRCGESCGTCSAIEKCELGQCVDKDPPWPDMVRIDSGEFIMGCDDDLDGACQIYETPRHRIQLSTYDIDRHEVTVEDYATCVDAGACAAATNGDARCNWGVAGRARHPINCADWFDAEAYCRFSGKRLPTEAEWEKAARGDDGRAFAWGNAPVPDCDHAIMLDGSGVFGCGADQTAVVGSVPAGASPYGVQDMAGNQWEWVADWFAADYYQHSPTHDPKGPDTGTERTARGGGLKHGPDLQRTYVRAKDQPTGRGIDCGFRCARTPNLGD